MSESKTNRAYILVMGIEPMEVGGLYKHELHSTLLHWFYSQQEPQQIEDLIEPIFSSTKPFSIRSGKTADFGGGKPLPVNLINKTPELKDLHDKLRNTLETIGVKYLNPEYIGEGWRPHVTVQGSKSLPTGQSVTIKDVYLVECSNGPDVPPVAVVAKYRLGSENAA